MLAEHVGDVHRQRTVDENRELGDGVGLDQFVQQQHQLLGSPYSKCGHDHFPAPLISPVDDLGQFRGYRLDGFVYPVAVGAFHDEVVDRGHRLGIANDGQSGPPQVARKAKPNLLPAGLQLQAHGGRSEDMPGFERLINHARANFSGRVQRDWMEEGKGGFGVLGCIQRLDGFVEGNPRDIQGLAPQIPLVQKFGVVFLQRSRILQHGPAQVRRGGAGVDGPAKSVLHQQREIAAVIDMRVRQHHRGNIPAGKREVSVALGGFLSAALILAAIQQITFVAHH